MKMYSALALLIISSNLCGVSTVLDSTTRRWGINSHQLNIPHYFMPEESMEPPTKTTRREHYKSRPSRRARNARKQTRKVRKKRQPKKRGRITQQA